MRKIATGLIGFGTGGRIFHAPFIHGSDQYLLRKISTSNRQLAAAAQSQFPEAEFVTVAAGIFNDPAIELVIIATPNASHFSLAKSALLSGKHVIVEKPFTVNVAEADELIELAESRKLVITVNQNRRWDSDFRTVRKIIDQKLLGDLVEYEAHFDRFRNVPNADSWKEKTGDGTGIVFDLGVHLVDQALCLFGKPASVFATLAVQRKGGRSTDNFEILLLYKNLKVTLKAGMLVRVPLPHFILLGTQGSFVKYGMDVQEAALKNGLSPYEVKDWGREPETLWGKMNTDVAGLHREELVPSERGDYRDFFSNVYDAIVHQKPPAVSAKQARDVILIIEMAIKSDLEKRVVAL